MRIGRKSKQQEPEPGQKRRIDKAATKAARTRHAAGVEWLRTIFGSDSAAAAALEATRRETQGQRRSPTRENWTRPERRAAGRAARAARRGQALQGRTQAKARHRRNRVNAEARSATIMEQQEQARRGR